MVIENLKQSQEWTVIIPLMADLISNKKEKFNGYKNLHHLEMLKTFRIDILRKLHSIDRKESIERS